MARKPKDGDIAPRPRDGDGLPHVKGGQTPVNKLSPTGPPPEKQPPTKKD